MKKLTRTICCVLIGLLLSGMMVLPATGSKAEFTERVANTVFLYDKKNRVRIGNEICVMDAKNSEMVPVMQDDEMMVPAQFLQTALGLDYTGDLQTARLTGNHRSVLFTQGASVCEQNGTTTSVSAVPRVLHDALYVPLRDVCRFFDISYSCDANGVAIAGDEAHADWDDAEDFAFLTQALRDIFYESPKPQEVLARLCASNASNRHPRLLLNEERVNTLRQRVVTQEPQKSWFAAVRDAADASLNVAEKLTYELEDGVRLLYVSRRALSAVENMGFAYQMTGEQKYADGVIDVLMKVCGDAFPDWHPYHFLDTAEMAAAVAIGYDWCYNAMTEMQRKLVRDALVEKALRPVMEDYNEVPGRKRTWYWSSKTSAAYPQNWLAVCFGGTSMAALAIADEDLGAFTEAGEVICEGMERVKDWLDAHMPDGVCPDGTGYWEYSMAYMVYGMESLRTALGTDYGLTSAPAFDLTYTWLVQMMGPGGAFNLESNNANFKNSPEFFWHSAQTGNPSFANYRLRQLDSKTSAAVDHDIALSYKDIMWYEPDGADESMTPALDFSTRGSANLYATRSGYDKADSWCAMLGGRQKKNESSFEEEGTFVLDMLGERWAMDLGAEWQTYVSFDVPRNQYYRFRAEGHNTIVANPDGGREYDLSGKGKQIRFEANAASSLSVYDLSSLLASQQVTSWQRGLRLDRTTGVVTLQDEISAEKETEFYWFMHTDAEITLTDGGKTAILQKNGKQIQARLLPEDTTLCFAVMDAVPLSVSPNPKQTENTGVQKLAVHTSGQKNLRMAVDFVPQKGGIVQYTGGTYESLAAWQLKQEESPAAADNFLPQAAVSVQSNAGNYYPALPLSKMLDGNRAAISRYATDANRLSPLTVTVALDKVYSFDTLSVFERFVSKTCSDSTTIELGTKEGENVTWAMVVSGAALQNGPHSGQAVADVVETEFDMRHMTGNMLRLTFDRKNGDYVQHQIVEIEASGAADNPIQNVFCGKSITTNLPARAQLPATAMVDGMVGWNSGFPNRYASGANPQTALVIDIDLGGRYMLSSFSIAERWLAAYNKQQPIRGCYDSVTIETGLNTMGVTKYVTAASNTAVNSGTRDNETVVTTVLPQEEAVADRVRITLERADGYIQYEIFEIEGIGRKMEEGESVFKLSQVQFEQNGMCSDNLPKNGTFTTKMCYNTADGGTSMLALYNAKGSLILCAAAACGNDITVTVSEGETACEARIFTFADAKILRPKMSKTVRLAA